MKKRGLSNILNAILIILAGIVAIILIFSFLNPFLKKTEEQTQVTFESLSLSIIPESVKINKTYSYLEFVVSHKSGELEISALNIILEDENQRQTTIKQPLFLKPLEKKQVSFIYDYRGLSNLSKIKIFPILKIKDKEYNTKIFSSYTITNQEIGVPFAPVESLNTCWLQNNCSLEICNPSWYCSSWSICQNSQAKRSCTDENNCNILDSKPPESIGCFNQKESCSSNIFCTPWDECSYTNSVEDILKGNLKLTGSQSRVCQDLNYCIITYSETNGCSLKIPLHYEKTEICGEKTLTAFNNKTGNPVFIVKLESWNQGKLDIIFVQNSSIYCPSCYNGVLDKNEDKVDCGGDCMSCK